MNPSSDGLYKLYKSQLINLILVQFIQNEDPQDR